MRQLLKLLPDALLAGGATAIAAGAWMIYAPAGFIVGGIGCIAFGWLLAKAD